MITRLVDYWWRLTDFAARVYAGLCTRRKGARMQKTEAVVCYLLGQVRPRCINKTKLIKLSYLADLESVRRFGRFITGQQYTQDEHGAVSYDIPNTARKIPGVLVDDHPTHTGKHGTDFCAGPDMPDAEYDLTIAEKIVLDDVLERFGKMTATALGIETKRSEPWSQATELGVETLDLSVVAPSDRDAYRRHVLSGIDRSTRGTPEQIAERNAEIDEFMRPLRSAAISGR